MMTIFILKVNYTLIGKGYLMKSKVIGDTGRRVENNPIWTDDQRESSQRLQET